MVLYQAQLGSSLPILLTLREKSVLRRRTVSSRTTTTQDRICVVQFSNLLAHHADRVGYVLSGEHASELVVLNPYNTRHYLGEVVECRELIIDESA